ncbi:MAG TPA: ATP-binding cassette domain-containing protein, partial [Lentisphaeria bacterium]|nr:ATP-binding cassette domain-containing protein [Lentisphaeria bacterium]
MAAAAVQPLLDIRGLTVEFAVEGGGSLRAVDGVSLQLAAGGTLGLVGESGCGKTVTAMSIPRLVPQPPGRIVGGEIRLQGKELLRLPIRELRQIRGRDIGVIFQEPMTALSPLRRIGDQLVEVV